MKKIKLHTKQEDIKKMRQKFIEYLSTRNQVKKKLVSFDKDFDKLSPAVRLIP